MDDFYLLLIADFITFAIAIVGLGYLIWSVSVRLEKVESQKNRDDDQTSDI